jgi:hypothetical protein
VLTPLASYFWWAENVRTLIHHARSIVVIANQLTAGLVSEMEEVLEQGRGGQTLVLALPSRDPKSSPFASEAPNGALAAYVEARFPNRCVLSSSDASRTFWLQALARWAGEPTAENASLVGAALEYGRAHPDSEVTSALAGSERRFELEIKDRVAASDFNSWLRSRRR